MQKVRVPTNSFQYGEVSDSLLMRTDTTIYSQSVQRLENMLVMAEGSAKKRQGLKHIYNYSIAYDANNPAQSHLFKFIFDDNEQYVISIEHEKVRCFQLETNGNVTLVSTLTADVDSNTLPFNKQYLQEYTTAQYGDAMFICHPLFAPRVLSRTSLTSFEIDTYSFDTRADNNVTYQPYTRFHAQGVTLDPSATTGTDITLTTSVDYWDVGSVTTADVNAGSFVTNNYYKIDTVGTTDFTAIGANSNTVGEIFKATGAGSGTGVADLITEPTHIGSVIRYGDAEIEITHVRTATVAVGDVVDELRIRLETLNPFRTIDGSATVEVTQIAHGFEGGESITIEEASALGGINAGNLNGARTVGEIIDENTYTFTAGGNANTTEDGGGYVKVVCHAPTTNWDEQAWSAKRGYPAAVTFHENRLCFGGTIAEPDKIWMSQIGRFFNFDVGTAQDTESIQLVAATGDVNEIRYLVSNRDLQVFTANSELYVPTYLNQAITPTNAQIRKQTPYGCEFVQPNSIDGATIFAQHDGKIIREYIYTDSEDAYTASSVSTLASHLIDDPKCMAVAHSGFGLPDSYAALTLGSGDMALFSSNRAEKRASWSRVTTDGNFCSVVSLHNRLFVNVWYDDQLHLCEFDTEVGLDNWSSATYNQITYSNFNASSMNGVFVEFATTVPITITATNTLSVGDKIYLDGFTNQSLWSFAGLDLVDLNGTFQTITEATSSYFKFEYELDSALDSDGEVDSTPNSEAEIIQGVVFDVSNIYTDTDDITLDVIYTLDGVSTHETVSITGQSDSSENFFLMSSLGTSGPDSNTTVYAGRKFTSKIVTNPIDANIGNGPATGNVRGITNVVVDVKSTESMDVNSNRIIESSFTGKKEVKLLGYNRNPQVTIEQDKPLLMQVNGIVAELIV